MKLSESKLRRIIREEVGKIRESTVRDSADFIDELVEAIGDNHMGYTVERAATDTVRFFTTSNGTRIHVHGVPYFNGRTEDMTVSLALNDETVRQGIMAFYGNSMVQELNKGNLSQAAEMYKDGINPVLEAGYGLAKIQKV